MKLTTCFLQLLLCFLSQTQSFVVKSTRVTRLNTVTSLNESSNNENPVKAVFDMFSNMDAVMDDFFFKRMGNGEQFYGKRKYNPSGKVEGDYSGFGLSDKTKIDVTREYKEEWLDKQRQNRERQEAFNNRAN